MENIKKKSNYSNARNFISAYTNKKEIHSEIIKLFDFIAFEYKKENEKLKYFEQLKKLESFGFKTPNTEIIQKKKLNNNIMNNMLSKRKENGIYEIDGLVISSNTYLEENKNKYPETKIAFKNNTDFYKTVVKNIKWNPSMYGLLKPIVIIEPVEIDNVVVRNVTGNNARYLMKNKIGIGSLIEITRSGGVIPKIEKVIKNSDQLNLPPYLEYKWCDNKIDFILENTNTNDIVNIKRLEYFFIKQDINFFKYNLIKKFYEKNIKNIEEFKQFKDYKDILNLKIDNIKEKLAKKLYKELEKLENIKLNSFMSGCWIFKGFSDKKINMILNNIPDILTYSNMSILKNKIKKIKGFSNKSSESFLKCFLTF